MLYICIPVHNEAPTIGVLLWRLRKVFQEYSREYEIIVYDDASTDSTRETAAQYAEVLPLSVIEGKEHRGYAHAVDALARAASTRTRYPRRDAMILLQGDFTDPPEVLPDFIKRFEGGADIVVGERAAPAGAPVAVRRFSRVAGLLARPLGSVSGVRDPYGTLRLFRISLVRDALKADAGPLATGPGWAANADLLRRLAEHARRIETVEVTQRFDLRPRESRVRPWADTIALLKHGRHRPVTPPPASPPAPARAKA